MLYDYDWKKMESVLLETNAESNDNNLKEKQLFHALCTVYECITREIKVHSNNVFKGKSIAFLYLLEYIIPSNVTRKIVEETTKTKTQNDGKSNLMKLTSPSDIYSPHDEKILSDYARTLMVRLSEKTGEEFFVIPQFDALKRGQHIVDFAVMKKSKINQKKEIIAFVEIDGESHEIQLNKNGNMDQNEMNQNSPQNKHIKISKRRNHFKDALYAGAYPNTPLIRLKLDWRHIDELKVELQQSLLRIVENDQ